MKVQNLALVAVATLAVAGGVFGQCVEQSLPAGYETYTANYITGTPFGGTADQHVQFICDSSEFAASGPVVIKEVYVRVFDANTGGFYPSVEVSLASAVNDYDNTAANMLSFAGNMGPDLTLVRPAAAFNPGPQPGQRFVPLGIQNTFIYNPTLGNDFLVDIKRCGAGTPWTHPTFAGNVLDAKGPTTPIRMRRYSLTATTACTTGLAPTTNQSDFCAVLLVSYYPVGSPQAEWQVNTANASFDLDGNGFNRPCGGAIDVTRYSNQPINANLNSALLGNPWDLAFGFGFGVPASAGGFTLANGDVVNVDLLSAPSFLLGLTFAVPFSATTLPFALPAPITLDLYAQMVMLNPATAGGFNLSALTQLHLQPSQAVFPGPAGDDEALSVPLWAVGGAPLSIPFYGVNYNTFNLISNGRIMFGTPNTNCCPGTTQATAATAALADSAFAAVAWCDMNPSIGGNITVTSPGAGQVAAHWSNVPYFGNPTTSNTFDLIVDAVANTVQFNYTALQAFPSAPSTSPEQFIGVSAGVGVATDQGATTFAVGGPITGPANNGMVYQWAVNGPTITGIQSIIFTWNTVSNQYDWVAF